MNGAMQAPRLSQEKARFLNALVSRFLPLHFCLDNGLPNPPKVELTCLVNSAKGENSAYTLYVNCNGLWRLDFDNLDILRLRPELDQWLSADRDNRFALLPEGMVRAVLERLFLAVLDDFSRFSGMPALFVGAPKPVTRPRFSEYLDFLLRVEGERSITSLVRLSWQDSSTLLPVVERLEILPLHVLTGHTLSSLQLRAAVEIGSMQLTFAEMSSLRVGDVLLPTNLNPDQPCLRLGDGLRLIASLNQCTLTLQHKETASCGVAHGVQMSDTAENTTRSTAQNASGTVLLGPEELGRVELDITFELPAIKLSLAECSRLVPGTTFTLSADAANLPVTVLVSGRPVAIGRLVDVGGTLGVQLTQLASKAASESFAEHFSESTAEKAVD